MEKEKRNHEENMKKKNLTVKKKMTAIEQVIKVQAKKKNEEGRPQGEKDWKKTYLGKK